MPRIIIGLFTLLATFGTLHGDEVDKLISLLDLERPELAAVKTAHEAGDNHAALAAWNEILRARFPRSSIKPKVINNVHRDADEALKLRFRSRPSNKYYQLHEEFDWKNRPEEIATGHWLSLLVSLHQLTFLADVYLKTGDPKYAKGCVRLYDDWSKHCPPGSGSPSWSLATTLIRSGVLLRVSKRLLHWPDWPPEAQARMMTGLYDHAQFMVARRGRGNQDAANSEHLMRIAHSLPDFKAANHWLTAGYERISERIFEDVLDDGTQRELTTGYHQNAVNTYSIVAERMAAANKPLSPAFRQRLEKMYEWAMVLARPDGSGPVNGDSVGSSMLPILERGARLFNRPDMRYVATRGKEGSLPSFVDASLPVAGYYVMRSDWTDPHGLYLFVDASQQPVVSHQDYDALHLNLFAFGRNLLPDKGTYTYGGDYHKAAKATRNHSTLTINDNNQRDVPCVVHEFRSATEASYFDGAQEPAKGQWHRRQAALVKPATGLHPYVVVVDRVWGDGIKTADQYWHLPPGELQGFDKGAAATAFPTGNLAIRGLLLEDVETTSMTTEMHPRQGKTVERPAIRYRRPGPSVFATLLLPYPDSDAPDLTAKAEIDGDGRIVVRVSQAETTDVLTFDKSTTDTIGMVRNSAAKSPASVTFVSNRKKSQ